MTLEEFKIDFIRSFTTQPEDWDLDRMSGHFRHLNSGIVAPAKWNSMSSAVIEAPDKVPVLTIEAWEYKDIIDQRNKFIADRLEARKKHGAENFLSTFPGFFK